MYDYDMVTIKKNLIIVIHSSSVSVFFFSLFTSIINKVINNQAQGVDSRHDCDFKNNNRPMEGNLI